MFFRIFLRLCGQVGCWYVKFISINAIDIIKVGDKCMYTEDMLFQIVMKYNYDLYRGPLDISTYMKNHFDQYINDLNKTINSENPFLGESFINKLNEKIPLIEEVCDELIDISQTYRDGYIKAAYEKSYTLFESLSPYYLSRFSWNGRDGDFYRIREGDFRIKEGESSKKKKAELFHIKNGSRHLIGAYRYSVSGFPCLYLSSSRELCWFECGMPKQFSYCQMIIEENGENALRLIDFSNRPIDLLSSTHVWLLNNRDNENEKTKIYDYLLNYIITYPLAAACSIKVSDRGSKFVEEYIIPQIFMQWVRESEKFDGIRYKSSLNSSLVNGMGAVNIALPVKRFRNDGLCENLTSKIAISDIGFMDVNKDFEKYREYLKDIENFKNALWANRSNSEYHGEYELRLIDFCEIVLKTYGVLINGRYDNSELIFSYIDCLLDYAYTIYSSKESIVNYCLKNAYPDEKDRVNPSRIETHIDTFYSLITKVVHKHAVFNLDFVNHGNFEKI